MPLVDGQISLVAHIVFNPEFIGNREEKYKEIDNMLKDILCDNVVIDGYKEHLITFECSPTTVKKDRKGLMKELDGYIKVFDNEVYTLCFEQSEGNELTRKYELLNTKKLRRIKK